MAEEAALKNGWSLPLFSWENYGKMMINQWILCVFFGKKNTFWCVGVLLWNTSGLVSKNKVSDRLGQLAMLMIPLVSGGNIQVYQPHSEVPRPCYVVEGLSCVSSAELFQNRCRSWLQFEHTCFWNCKMLVSNPFRTVSARIGTIFETWLEASWSPSLTYAENQRFWE